MEFKNRREMLVSLSVFLAVFSAFGYMISEPISFLHFLAENPSELDMEMIGTFTVLNSMLLISAVSIFMIMYAGEAFSTLAVFIYRKLNEKYPLKEIEEERSDD